MCGIAGLVLPPGQSVQREQLEAMARGIRSRGPDALGIHLEENLGLVHQRLKIIDLSDAANQPMHSPDGRISLVFNGEIYNFRELRAELEEAGCRFKTHSDTEVALHAYLVWGEDCFPRFNGMFAIGLIDHREKPLKVLLARDRFGIKPLFYYHSGATIAFASVLKPLLTLPFVQKRINRDAVFSFLKHSHVPTPYSLVEGTAQLAPGQLLACRGGEISTRTFAQGFPPVSGEIENEKEALDLLGQSLGQAVKRQSVADVPVGCFLSGGIDSTLLLAAYASKNPRPLDTFTIGYTEKEFDERKAAALAALAFGSRHHEILLGPKDFLDLIPRLPEFLDQPLADPTLLPSMLLSQRTREHVTVAFSGDGGDELFLGYTYQKALLEMERYLCLPKFLRQGLFRALELGFSAMNQGIRSHGLNQLIKLAQILQYETEVEKYQYFIGTIGPLPFRELRALVPGGKPVNDAGYAEILAGAGSPEEKVSRVFQQTFLIDTALTKSDRASMAYGLETRVPLLDNEFVSAAQKVSYSLKLHRGRKKHILRELLRRQLPEAVAPELCDRPKQGFSVPLRDWLRKDLSFLLKEFLSEEKIRREGIFNERMVQQLVQEHLSGRKNNSHLLWSLLCFEQWRSNL
jgi:asparagine synthase (glutamine-hydrolysing)